MNWVYQMKNACIIVTFIYALLLPGSDCCSQAGDLYIVGGAILPITSGKIQDGTIIVRDGKIEKLLSKHPGRISRNARVINAEGLTVMPGLVDAHTHFGLLAVPRARQTSEMTESSSMITPYINIIDGINLKDEAFNRAMSFGLTTVGVWPASSNLIAGRGMVLKTAGEGPGRILHERFDMKMALGMNPKAAGQSRNVMPVTRMGAAIRIRDALNKAVAYKKKMESQETSGDVAVDPELEPLRKLLAGEYGAHIHCARADDILFAVELAETYGFRISLVHVYEGYKVADILSEKGVPVSLGPVVLGWDQGKQPTRPINVAGVMAEAGVELSITTDYSYIYPEYFLFQAALCHRLGLERSDALCAVTINPAKLARVDDRVGSLEEGKDADIIILDGDPLDLRTRIVTVIIDGIIRYEKKNEH